MVSRTLLSIVATVLILTAVSLGAAFLEIGALRGHFAGAWHWVAQAIFVSSIVVALVWSTGLARRWNLGGAGTAVLALVLSVVVLFATSYATEVSYQALRSLLFVPDPRDFDMMTRLDVAWAVHHVVLCMLYALPFAVWRGFQRRRRSAPGTAVTPTA